MGAIFGLPKLEAKISQVVDVNDRCEAVNATAFNVTAVNTTTVADGALNSLTLIEPSVVLDVELIAEVDIAAGRRIDFNAQWPLVNKTFALPTACLRYDVDARTYAPAAMPATTGTGGGGQGSGGLRLRLGVGTSVLGGLLLGVMAVMVAM